MSRENRRKLIAGSAILIFALSLLAFAGSAVAGSKITICHLTPPNNSNGKGTPPHEYVLITISVNALPAHVPHGDFPGETQDDCDLGLP